MMYVRSFLGIAGGIEFDAFNGESLKRIDRFEYLRDIIESHGSELEEMQDLLSQQRTQYDGKIQSAFENEDVSLFRISDSGAVDEFNLSYKIGFNTFMNNILLLNIENR